MVKIIQKQATTALRKQKTVLLAKFQPPIHLLRASYVRQYLTCGKKNCRCLRGFKHGPFYYLAQCLGTGNVRKFLLKTPEQRRQARAGIAAHLKYQRQLAELSEINTELLRRGEFLKLPRLLHRQNSRIPLKTLDFLRVGMVR